MTLAVECAIMLKSFDLFCLQTVAKPNMSVECWSKLAGVENASRCSAFGASGGLIRAHDDFGRRAVRVWKLDAAVCVWNLDMWPTLVAVLAVKSPALPSARGAVLSLYDEKSRSKIVLVGSMHFNPRSINLARQVVEEEANSGRLRAVAVESCPTRWNATLEAQPAGSFLRSLCDNEMQSAAEAGQAAGVHELALVDQTIEDTGKRVAQLFALTLVELVTPWQGGWNRIYDDFKSALEQVGGEGLGPDALLDPRLLLGIPLSLVRYPLSLGLKSPVLLALIGCIFLIANQELAAEDTIEQVRRSEPSEATNSAQHAAKPMPQHFTPILTYTAACPSDCTSCCSWRGL